MYRKFIPNTKRARRAFTKSADYTKAVNLGRNHPRGGIRF